MPVEVVLPCAPATATRRRRLISQASACERCSTGMPRVERELVLRVVLPERARDDEGVGVADVGGVVADRDPGAERAQLGAPHPCRADPIR